MIGNPKFSTGLLDMGHAAGPSRRKAESKHNLSQNCRGFKM